MNALFLSAVLALNMSNAAFALDNKERLDATYLAIGAFEISQSKLGQLNSEGNITPSLLNIPKNSLYPYYQQDYMTYYLIKKHEKSDDEVRNLGKQAIEKIVKKIATPFCVKLSLCKLHCYLSVVEDIVDEIVSSQPELISIRYIVQNYVIQNGAKYLEKLCGCK